MKIFIIHEPSGKIRGVLSPSPGTGNASMQINASAAGLQVHEMEVDDVQGSERQKFLFDIHRNHSLDVISKERSLVRKKSKK